MNKHDAKRVPICSKKDMIRKQLSNFKIKTPRLFERSVLHCDFEITMKPSPECGKRFR